MKFTKSELLDTLKGKLTANGKHLSISEKTIKSLSDSHYDLLVNEETELDDLVKKILPQYVSLNGNYEKDNADFIKKWNEEHPADKPKPQDKPSNTPDDEFTKKLLERLDALEKKDAENEAAKLVSQKRSELLAMFKEKGIKDTKWADKYLSKLNITKDTDLEQETSDALDFYNLSHSKPSNNTPGGAGGGGDDDKTDWSDVVSLVNPNAGE